MDRLIKILENKKLPDRLTKIIISLYEEVVKFWGLDKEELILDTIKEFEIICVDNLAKRIEEVSGGKVNPDGVGKNNLGLCEIIPIVKNQKIINIRKVILLDNDVSDKELSSILLHELFFHGTKSMLQPYMSENTIMQGLASARFSYDINDKFISIERSEGRGLEEISTYFGQNTIMNNLYGENLDIDYLLLDIANSLGRILMDTTLGKMILEAQITKNSTYLEKRFEATENYRLLLTGEKSRITWKDYNTLMDKFMRLCTSVYTREENDTNNEQLIREYVGLYYQLSNLNIGIFSATLLLDSNDISKKKGRN